MEVTKPYSFYLNHFGHANSQLSGTEDRHVSDVAQVSSIAPKSINHTNREGSSQV
jgi:hypothetical protein